MLVLWRRGKGPNEASSLPAPESFQQFLRPILQAAIRLRPLCLLKERKDAVRGRPELHSATAEIADEQ